MVVKYGIEKESLPYTDEALPIGISNEHNYGINYASFKIMLVLFG